MTAPSQPAYKPLADNAGEMWRQFVAFNQAVFETDTAIDKKHKELIAVAVALATQCEGCLDAHSHAATSAGASAAELAEVVHIAAALRSGAAVVHGLRHVMPRAADSGKSRPQRP
ncbi:carboxymuconolactone decarboxylase family protein [Streptomyces sp. NPDC054808]